MALMLSTADNPFNPKTNWYEWFAWDTFHGHNTCGLLAQVTNLSDEISEADMTAEIDQAIEFLVELNPTGNLIKVEIDSESSQDES